MQLETHWTLLGVGLIFSIVSLVLLLPRENRTESRQRQSKNLFRENVIAKQIDSIVEVRVRQSRRLEVEMLCVQAGMPLKYIELFTISLITAALAGVSIGIVANNILLGILMTVFGFLFPRQVIVFVRNRRVEKMGNQIGSFMHMALKRYEAIGDFSKAIELSTEEFKGEEPLYTELKETTMAIQLGVPTQEAMDDLAMRTGNVYLRRLSDYYKISMDVGTEDSRTNLMNQAYLQYEENRKTKQLMRKELSGVKRDAYIMLGAIPAVGVFQAFATEDYIHFMTQETIGQIGLSAIAVVFVGALWFINNKISAPLE